jgi:hypothetical protein
MKFSAMIAAAAIGTTVVVAGQAVAQGRQFETPLYTTGGQSSLEKNYGLPTFGQPGMEVPKPQATAPQAEPTPKTDFFAGTSDLTLSRNRGTTETETDMETPRYTTSQGTTDGYDIGSKPSETTTPLFGTAAMPFGTRPGR